MEPEAYEWKRTVGEWSYEFFSSGPKGGIRKIVRFNHLEHLGESVYNLAFGDWDPKERKLDDLVVTNYGDRLNVLYTVASVVLDFMGLNPKAILLISGSTSSRTRLYQMGISKYWKDIKLLFDILGENGHNWEEFRKGVNYNRFLVVGKTNLNYRTMKSLKQDDLVKEPGFVYQQRKFSCEGEPDFKTEEEMWVWVFENTNLRQIISMIEKHREETGC